MKQAMVDLTVVYENPTIPPSCFVTGPHNADDFVDRDAISLPGILEDLRNTAERELGTELTDEQCFYRIIHKAD